MTRIAKAVTAYRFVTTESFEWHTQTVEFFHLDGTKTQMVLDSAEIEEMNTQYNSSPDAIDLTF